MKRWQWVTVWVWIWMAGLGTVETDSDQASLLAVAQFIGEKPVMFVKTGSSPGLFQHLLVGTLVVAFFLLLFQICMHVSFQKGA
ncbi:fertilization-influencing membrane protein isoform X4 [Rattus norvegicus]|uniref:fertilization-influencing membrane protein isoform X4 n=1 Tax=Rattus norvegicus TaxID=10116 RepID=UPI002FD80023